MSKVNRELTMMLLPSLATRDIHWLLKVQRRELRARAEAAWALKERVTGGLTGLANVMKGVTWALACRQSLRRSKEHAPDVGKRPASGEMWLPAELLYCVRHEVKERGWSPLTQQYADGVLGHLAAETARANWKPPEMGAIAFRIPFARETASVFIDENVLTGRS